MKNTITIDGEEIGFNIYPQFGKVIAEIYKKSKMFKDSDYHISLLKKEFGNFFRLPIEQDYINARKWCDIQMKSIENANR